MELSYSHSHSQRILRQRNILAIVASGLCALTLLLFIFTVSRDREVVLQPILRSPVTVSSAGVSREYLEMITSDTVVLTLHRSTQNLEYRSEERSVGQECVRKFRSRWSPYTSTTKKNKNK